MAAKPKFNPNQPFEALKPKFDPSMPFDTPKEQVGAQPSGLESGLRGLAQGASLGFADELAGGAGALGDVLSGESGLSDLGGAYTKNRDESRALYDAAQAANPKTFMGAETAGAIGSAFVPGLGILNAGRGATLGAMAGKAALQGGIQGLGTSESDSAGGLLSDTAEGGAYGAGGGFLGAGIGKVATEGMGSLANSKVGQYLLNKLKGGTEAVGSKLDDVADFQAARALGLERATQKKLGRDAVKDIGRQALDNDILSVGASTDTLIGRNQALMDSAMGARSGAYEAIDKAGASQFSPLEAATAVENKVLGGKNRAYLDTQKLAEKLQPELDNILSRGDGNIPMSEAQKLVESVGKYHKFDQTRSNEANDLAKDIYFSLREKVNEAAGQGADSVGIPGLRQVVEDANRKYSVGKNTETILGNKSAREQGNKLVSLTDTVAGSSLGPLAAPVVLAKKVGERYGNQTAALTANKLADLVRMSPESLGKYGPALEKAAARGGASVAVTHQLLQQTDPEYRKKMREAQGLESEE